ncbi:MAG TPA: winged helix-turn-helix domain-containing protein, partial [Acidobacteriaceae bacterium]
MLSISLNRLLLLFVTHPGEVVTRKQIADALWEEHATIDVVAGINTAVRRLRTHLEETGGQSGIIETLVGVGYRFTAPVSVSPSETSSKVSGLHADTDATMSATVEATPADIVAEVAAEDDEGDSAIPEAASDAALPPTKPAGAQPLNSWWISWRGTVAAAAVVLIGTAAAAGWNHFKRPVPELVAGTPFLRHTHPVTYDEPEDGLTAQAISPGGGYIVYAERSGLTLQTLGPTPVGPYPQKRLDIPKEFHVESLAWFPDESGVLASGTLQPNASGGNAAPKSQVWRVALSGTQSRVLLEDAGMASVSPDGHSIAYLRGGKTEVWLADITGDRAHRLIAAGPGESFSALLWSPRSDRIVVDRQQSGIQIFPTPDVETGATSTSDAAKSVDGTYETYDAGTGALRSRYAGLRFDSAILLQDGRLLYLSTNPPRPGLGVAQTDPATGTLLNQKDQKLLSIQEVWDGWANAVTQLSGTRNGETLSVILDKPAVDVYTADFVAHGANGHPALGHIARLSFHAGKAYPSAWTPDGRSVAFDDGTGGPVSVAVQALDGSPLKHLAESTQETLVYTRGQFSPDGKWLLFQEYHSGHPVSVNRAPAGGGTPEALHTTGTIEEFHCSASAPGRCVLREAEGKTALVYYALDPVSGIGDELARVPWQPNVLGDWNISPDGKTVAMANHDPQHPSIQLVPLPPASGSQPAVSRMKEIPLQGFGTAFSAHWSADGKALFVEAYKAPGYELVWLTLDGHASLLRQSTD